MIYGTKTKIKHFFGSHGKKVIKADNIKLIKEPAKNKPDIDYVNNFAFVREEQCHTKL